MKKINQILIALPIALTIAPVSAQVQFRGADRIQIQQLADAARLSVKNANADANAESIDIIIRYDSEETLDRIEQNGGKILSRVGYHGAIVRVSPEQAEAVAGVKGVRSASLSKKVATKNNRARYMSMVDNVWAGTDMPQPVKGAGTLIGIYDVGMDPNHITFKNADGSARVERFWGYGGSSAVPTVYDTPTKIKYFTTDSRTDSHGTHVLGIMTGSFRDTVTSGAPDYRGVAPEARIAASGGAGYLSQILDAMERVGSYAKENQLPCVANLSFGDNIGPHDGTDAFTANLNEIADKYDMVLCVSAGNERADNVAVVKTFTPNDTTLVTLLKRGYRCSGSMQSGGEFQAWSQDGTPLEVTFELVKAEEPDSVLASFTVPRDKEVYFATKDATTSQFGGAELVRDAEFFSQKYTRSGVGGVGYVDEANKRYVADMYVVLNTVNQLDATTYDVYFRVKVKGKPGQKAYLYSAGVYGEFGGHNQSVGRYDVPDGFGSNSNMASGKNTLCVGSYVSNNITSSGYPSGVIGQTSYFSSYGETGDGREMPDVCAPGQVIVSTRNTYCTSSSYGKFYTYKDTETNTTYGWTTMAGTSQSSPHTAGVAALVRSANRQLTYKEVKDIIRSTAELPSTGKGWGRGRVNAWEAVKKAYQTVSVDEIIANGTDGIMVAPEADGIWRVCVPSEESFAVSLYSMSGSAVKQFNVAGGECVVATADLPSGVYVMNIRAAQGVKSVKICVK